MSEQLSLHALMNRRPTEHILISHTLHVAWIPLSGVCVDKIVLQNEVIKVFVVVDLVDEMIDTGRRLCCATLERLWTNYLAIVDD